MMKMTTTMIAHTKKKKIMKQQSITMTKGAQPL
jgi:hypothetical protein